MLLDKEVKRQMHMDDSRFECIKRMQEWFFSDVIILLDKVLADDEDDPEYSANTTYTRLELCLNFQNMFLNTQFKDISEFLFFCGYSEEDVSRFLKKCDNETQRYKGRL